MNCSSRFAVAFGDVIARSASRSNPLGVSASGRLLYDAMR
jgi:hypothetical protein